MARKSRWPSGTDATLSARGELDGTLDAPMVFVGYGLSIPEANWDDLAGLDLHGKIAVYVNAPAPVDVPDNVRSHVNSAGERWAVLKKAGAIGIATMPPPRPPTATTTGAHRRQRRRSRPGRHRRRLSPPSSSPTASVQDQAGQRVSLDDHPERRREVPRRQRPHARRARAADSGQKAAAALRAAGHAARRRRQ